MTVENLKNQCYIVCECGCNEQMLKYDKRGRLKHFLKDHVRKGPANSMWRGGKYISTHGYVFALAHNHPRANTGGYVFEHILVFEKEHNCCMLRWGAVHHIDGNRTHNEPSNLMGMMDDDHKRIPNSGQWKKGDKRIPKGEKHYLWKGGPLYWTKPRPNHLFKRTI